MLSPLPIRILQADDILFFIHIPKTAGTSMRAILDMHFDASTVCPLDQTVDLARFSLADLNNYRLVRGHLPWSLSRHFTRPAVLMTMLRHPVERTISYYRFAQRLVQHPLHDAALQMSLVDFVAAHRHHVIQQTAYLSADFDGTEMTPLADEQEALAVARTRLDTMAFVGVMEAFRPSIDLLSYTLAWRPLTIYPELNRAPDASTRDAYTPEEIHAIEELNAVDIELYHHGLLLFQSRYHQMLQALLEHHYDCHNPAWDNPQTRVEIRMDQAFYGESWHNVEYLHDHRAYRWSGPARVSSVDVGLVTDQSYQIEIHVLFAISEHILDTWHLRVHDVIIPLQRTLHPEVGHIYRGIIPVEALRHGRRFTRLEIVVNETLRPCDVRPGSTDERDLALAVASFKLQHLFPP